MMPMLARLSFFHTVTKERCNNMDEKDESKATETEERKEDIIETQNEVEKDKEDVIEDEVKYDQKTDDDIKGQLDRMFDSINGISERINKIESTVAGFVDYGGIVREDAGNETIEENNDNKKFVPIEDLDLTL